MASGLLHVRDMGSSNDTEGADERIGEMTSIGVLARRVTGKVLIAMALKRRGERDAGAVEAPAPVTATGDTRENVSRVKGSGR